MGLVVFIVFFAVVVGGMLALAVFWHRHLPAKYAGIALGTSLLVGVPVLFLLPAYLNVIAAVAAPLLLAWLTDRYLPPKVGRLAFAALLLVAVAAFAGYWLAAGPVTEALTDGRLDRRDALALYRNLIFATVGALVFSTVFVPSLFQKNQPLWTVLYLLAVFPLAGWLWFWMGISICALSGTCP